MGHPLTLNIAYCTYHIYFICRCMKGKGWGMRGKKQINTNTNRYSIFDMHETVLCECGEGQYGVCVVG
jgi:hypothetical protein